MTTKDNIEITDFPLFAGLKTRDERTNTEETTNPRYVLSCPNCTNRWTRERDSKIIKQARTGNCWCPDCGQTDSTVQLLIDAKHGITPDTALTQLSDDITNLSGHKATVYTDELGYVEAQIWEADHSDTHHHLLLHPNDPDIREEIGGMYIEVWTSQDPDTGEWSLHCELESEILNDNLDVIDHENRENILLGIEITNS